MKRYKQSIYKKIVKLNENVLNKRRIFLLKFKKRKWNKLNSIILRLKHRNKKFIFISDTNKYYLPKFYNSFQRKFKTVLQDKKKIKLFYGSLTEKRFKKNAVKIKNKFIFNRSFFLSGFERQLDVILFRAHFATSIKEAKQFIKHKHIRVNGSIVTKSTLKLKQGDILTTNTKIHNFLNFNIKTSFFSPLLPKYLQVNYKTFEIIFNLNMNLHNLSAHFPFKLYRIF